MTRDRRNALLAAALVAALAGAGGYVLGTDAAQRPDWHSATAVVVGEQDKPLVSIDVDGWTYAVEASVPHWTDARGAAHTGGWPTCLLPESAGHGTQAPREVPIRFAAIDVAADGLAWRQVVSVDCRPAG